MTVLLTAIVLPAAIATAVASVWLYRKWRHSEHTADHHEEHAHRLAQELRAAERFVRAVTDALSAGTPPARVLPPGGAIPPQPLSSAFADALTMLDAQVRAAVARVSQESRHAAEAQVAQERLASDQRVAEVRREAEQRVAAARQEAVEVARASVRAYASSTVQRASKLSSRISAGVRRHVSDEAYETLVEIDHLAQQMLLTASGYAVLAGEKLSRRHPDTTLTDVVRAAMGRVEGYLRVEHPEMDSVAVESRAVEAVIHTVAVLLDNALRYSPPVARVHVSLDYGHDAIFLNVDDAGLRMEDERLEWARRVMSGPERDDITSLGAYPQTGLRVAAVLAASYGFRVEVQAPNSRGGTRAFVVLPNNLLTAPAAVPPSQSVTPVEALPRQPLPVIEGPPGASSTTASGLTVRRRSVHAAHAPGPAPAADPVEPGRPSVATAFLNGTRRGRETPNTSAVEGR